MMDPVNVNVDVWTSMDATFMSYTLPLPDSIGSVSIFVAIHGADRDQDQDQDQDPPPMVFTDLRFVQRYTRLSTYIAVKPIGFYKNSVVMVYKAARASIMWNAIFAPDTFCALKVVDDDNPESIVLKKEVTSMENYWHDNLLEVSACFVDEQSKKLCVAMSHYPISSIRAIMNNKNRFPRGFPEDLILSVLRSVLNALQFLHGHNIMHRDIHAGHVYFCGNGKPYRPYLIKLGYSATVFDFDDDKEEEEEMGNPPYLPMTSMSKWGAAPEVYYGNQPYSEKADIWLVGITALELAYGGLKVSNRNALEAIIKDIKLPPSKTARKFKYYAKKLLLPPTTLSSSSSKNVNDDEELLVLPLLSLEEKPLFSRPFIKMVKQCLAWDPKKRPSAQSLLLSHTFFTNPNTLNREKDKYGQYFCDAFINKHITSN